MATATNHKQPTPIIRMITTKATMINIMTTLTNSKVIKTMRISMVEAVTMMKRKSFDNEPINDC